MALHSQVLCTLTLQEITSEFRPIPTFVTFSLKTMLQARYISTPVADIRARFQLSVSDVLLVIAFERKAKENIRMAAMLKFSVLEEK
jgi:hypothetical protein